VGRRPGVQEDRPEDGERADLAAALEEAADPGGANLCRRQLSRLDMARSYRHLLRFKRDRKGRVVDESEAERNLRELIPTRFSSSDNTLSRWLHVLDLPLVFQQAVDEGRLPLTLAVRVAGLKAAEQAQIAARVQAGEAPAKSSSTTSAPRANATARPTTPWLPSTVIWCTGSMISTAGSMPFRRIWSLSGASG
jgi:hypothetical protein